jgi:TolB-like protein
MVLAGMIYWQFYTPSRYLARGTGLAGLALVPFESLTPELDRANFARGLSDSLDADLSQQAGLQVVSPSTVRRHQWVGMSMGLMGRLLGLEVLVEGTVQKSGDRMTINARLVDVHTGKVIWAENYEYPAAELGQVELQAAREIAAQVGAHLGSGR